MTFSIVIPTKDEPEGLKNCVMSIIKQTVLPQELIIVDASSDSISAENQKNCENIVGDKIKLIYIRSIPSTTKQRNIGIDHATCDIIFFLDDDVILNEDYCEKILEVYEIKREQNVGGVRGTFSNRKTPSWFKRAFLKFFFMRSYEIKGEGRTLPSLNPVTIIHPDGIIKVESMPGGACSFYRNVLKEFKFDEILSEYAVGEDRDLSYRVSRKYKLYQTPYALLSHNFKPSYTREEKKTQIINEHYLAKKYLPPRSLNWLAYYWSLVGQLVFSFIKSCLILNSDELLGTLDGFKAIITKEGILSKKIENFSKSKGIKKLK
jgi:glycosyltransferase involved in cell wall biosynthesis